VIRHRALLVAAALTFAGCLPRLSDPAYAFQGLRAPEPRREGQTLLFGTVEFEPGFLGPHDVAEIVVKRLRPEEKEFERIVATKDLLYRAFRPRQVKGGHFVGPLDPGAYELIRLVGDDWTSTLLALDEDGRRASRFTVTRPGIVDVGVLHVRRVGMGRYSMEVLPPEARPGREAVLRAAVKGTHWERFLAQGGAR
jgi:hypothetical protein